MHPHATDLSSKTFKMDKILGVLKCITSFAVKLLGVLEPCCLWKFTPMGVTPGKLFEFYIAVGEF
jgi:hypothetical protein